MLIEDYPWEKDKKIFIDIVVVEKDDYIPIEIKFKTISQSFQYNVFGSNTMVGLGNQIAQNEGKYSFWKDVKRVESIQEKFNLRYPGIVLFITNDDSYKKERSGNFQYGPFSIHDGREVKSGHLNWNEAARNISPNRANKFPGFTLSKDYKIKWKKMENITDHHYILL
jgi:hypothetical protein